MGNSPISARGGGARRQGELENHTAAVARRICACRSNFRDPTPAFGARATIGFGKGRRVYEGGASIQSAMAQTAMLAAIAESAITRIIATSRPVGRGYGLAG
jgi:hypothetical protein